MKFFIRDTKKKADFYRKEGKIPGVIYGPQMESKAIYAEAKDFYKFLKAHKTGQAEIELEGQKIDVFLQDVQYHPVTDEIIHFDLYAVSASKPITTFVPIVFIGESPVIKKGGVLNISLDKLPVEALPKYLPEKIVVDLSRLENIHQTIFVRDLEIPKEVKVLISGESPVVSAIEEEKKEEITEKKE
jgi:large subunit ribosomal protein L25